MVGVGGLLRFGHTTALTTIQVVIHYRDVASLPRRPEKWKNYTKPCRIFIIFLKIRNADFVCIRGTSRRRPLPTSLNFAR